MIVENIAIATRNSTIMMMMMMMVVMMVRLT